ncbi:MAG: hypothetical protein WD036_01540, partial [Bauldia sp.]
MKSAKPWSLSDADEETRRALLKAAEQAGLSVSDWLGQSPEDDTPPIDVDATEEPEARREESEDSRALTAAISRLTERLGAMGQPARESFFGLKARLAEIERRLGEVAVAPHAAPDRGRSMREVTVMVEALGRDLDSADEDARTMIEGQHAGAERAFAGAPARRWATAPSAAPDR